MVATGTFNQDCLMCDFFNFREVENLPESLWGAGGGLESWTIKLATKMLVPTETMGVAGYGVEAAVQANNLWWEQRPG